MKCAFCKNDFEIFQMKQITLGEAKTQNTKYMETLDWQCNECKEKGLNTTEAGQRIRNHPCLEDKKFVKEV